MYFCPCSCSKPDGENEEDVLICLPRNLSYAGESYLDRYSVSSAFVHNAKLEKQLLQNDVQDQLMRSGADACAELLQIEQEENDRVKEEGKGDCCESEMYGARAMADPGTCADNTSRAAMFRGGPDSCDVNVEATMSLPTSPSVSIPAPFLPPLNVNTRDKNPENQSDFARYVTAVESPDSDMASEEGIFVNLMDDELDGLEGAIGKSTLSEASDDTYVSGDSMYYSPAEVQEMEDEDDLRVSLEEAVHKAASSMYMGRHSPPPLPLDYNEPELRDGSEPDSADAKSEEADAKAEDTGTTLGDAGTESEDTGTKLDDAGTKSEDTGTKLEDAGTESEDTDTKLDDGGTKSEDTDTPSRDSGAQSEGACTKPEVACTTSEEEACAKSEEGACAKSEEGACAKSEGARAKSEDSSMAVTGSGLSITVNDRPFCSDDRGVLRSSYRDFMSPESPIYEDREFNFTKAELRKSTSLKSSKTPPGTPRRKKVVRFADAMGLDLESVRHVLNLESPPKIPPSAMKDLQTGLGEERKEMGTKFIVETFQQPGADPNFRERVIAQKVVLENALIVSGSITGVVRVANIAYHKAVRVRFTTNDWSTFHDIAASYMHQSNDGPTDRFAFTIVPPPDFGPGSKLQFAISFSANGAEYWDNNYNNNYVFECFAKTVPTETENAWMHFL